MQAREPRHKVVFNARMRLGRSWSDVVIRDLSSRGMLLTAETPPPPGTYLEICGPATTLVARTVWAGDRCFGVRTQDRIEVESLLTGGRLRAQDPPSIQVRRVPVADAPAQIHQASRHRASLLEFIAAIAVIVAGAVAMAILLHKLFVIPMQVTSAVLGGG